jgi:uncharacterized membrane protein YphA (DoxX/SURF4 family)
VIPQTQRQEPIETAEALKAWSLPSRVALRFSFCYLVLFIYPTFLGSRPSTPQDQTNFLGKIWDAVVPWVGSRVLHLKGPFTPGFNGSGDQLYDYVLWLCLGVTAALSAAIWSLLDRKPKNYDVLFEWLRVFVRLTIAVFVIKYGLLKLFRTQFPELSLAKLVDTYGQTSPQGLLWTFMQYSRGYSFAGGVGEFVGGVLLLIPRFTALGALITLGMMSNVLMLNLFYDVPRKILCIHLVLLCLFLLAPDVRRLAGFLLLNRRERLTTPPPLFREKGFNTAALLLQLAIGVAAVTSCAHDIYAGVKQQPPPIQASLRGIWNVEQFDWDGAPRPPLVTDRDRWQRVILDRPERITIQLMDNTQQDFYSQWSRQNVSLRSAELPEKNGAIAIQNPQADQLVISGQIGGHRVSARLQRVDLSDTTKFLLTNRGFHWVDPSVLLR